MAQLSLDPNGAARLCHVDARTFRRWLSGRREPNATAMAVLRCAVAVPAARAWFDANRGAGLTD